MKVAVILPAPIKPPDNWEPLLNTVSTMAREYVLLGAETLTVPDDVPFRAADTLHELELLKEALLWAREQPVLLLSAGLTEPSPELARYLDFVRAGFDAVVPMVDRATVQPLFAMYLPTCRNAVASAISAGKLTIADVLGELSVRFVDPSEAAKFGELRKMLGPIRRIR
jgi:hypothetical protein